MAKKDDLDFQIEIPNFDDIDDQGMGDFTGVAKPKGRKPVKDFIGSFRTGIKDSLLNPTNQRKFLENAFPTNEGFLELFNTAGTIKSTVQDVYSDSKYAVQDSIEANLVPQVNKMTKMFGKSVPPKYRDHVKRLEEKTDRHTATADTSRADEGMNFEKSLDDLFSNIGNSAASESSWTRDTINEGNEKQIAATIQGSKLTAFGNIYLERIAQAAEGSLNYDTKVTSQFQRKMLELSYRHYAVDRENLDVTQKMLKMQEDAFEAIVKNTALPESQKIELSEIGMQSFKNQVFGKVGERIGGSLNDILGRVAGAAKKSFRESIEMAGSLSTMPLQMWLSEREIIQQQRQMEEEMGMAAPRTTGNKVGEAAAILAGKLLTKYGGKFVSKYSDTPGIRNASNTILNTTDALPSMLHDFIQNPGNETLRTLFGATGITQAVQWNPNQKVRGSTLEALDEQTFWKYQNDITLNEIIPGHLERINYALDVLAFGDKAERRRYDHKTGAFVTDSKIQDDIRNTFFKERDREGVQYQANAIIDQLDSKGELSPAARKELTRYIVRQANHDYGRIDVRALMSSSASPFKGDVAEEIARVLSSEHNFNDEVVNDYQPGSAASMLKYGPRYKNATFQAKQRGLHSSLETIRSGLPDHMKQAVEYIKTGNVDILEQMGIIERSGDNWIFNTDKQIDNLLGNTPLNTIAPEWVSGSQITGNVNRQGGPRGPFVGPAPQQPPPLPSIDEIMNQQASAKPMPVIQDNARKPPNEQNGKRIFDIVNQEATPFQRELLATIERSTARDVVGISNTLLEAIHERLIDGVASYKSDDEDGGGGGGGSRKSKRGLFRKLVSPITWASSKIGSYFKWSYGTALPSVLKAAINTPLTIGRGVGKIFGIGGNKIADPKKGFINGLRSFDIYIDGRETPIMLKRDIDAGLYIDLNTMKVIRRMNDITGAVVDKEGNIILSEEDFAKGLKVIKGGILLPLIGSGIGSMFSMAKTLVTAPYKGAWWVTKKVVGGAWNMLTGKNKNKKTKFVDVYLPGEDHPRLLATLLQSGQYLNTKGIPIRSMDDIDGDITDKLGNVVLSVKEMSNGLFDRYGEPLEEFQRKSRSLLAALLKAPFKAAWSITKFSAKVYRKTAGFIFGGAKAAVKRLFGRSNASGINPGELIKTDVFGEYGGLPLELMATSADTLSDIHSLLDARLPNKERRFDDDGQGMRMGSRESWLSRYKEAKAKDEKEKAKEKPKSLFGLIMAAVSGIGAVFGSIKAFGSRIWTMMKLSHQLSLASKVAGIFGSMGGGRRGRGAGKMGSLMARAGSVLKSSKALRYGGLAALGIGAAAFSREVSASDVGASIGILEQGAKNAMTGIDDSMGEGAASSASEMNEAGGFWENITKAAGASVAGEVAAIGTGAGAALLWDKWRNRGGRTPTTKVPKAAPTGTLGKVGNFLGTGKGRMLTALLSGAGIYAAMNGGLSDAQASSVDMAEHGAKSYAGTLALDLGMALGIPWLADKFMNRGAKGAMSSAYTPIKGAARTPLFNPNSPLTGPLTGTAAKTAASAAGGAAKTGGVLGKVGGAGKGIFKHAGILGTGYSVYDALTTEGSAKDKALVFGKDMAITAGTSKAMSVLGSSAGRAALMTGARGVGTYAASALGGLVSWPVLLGIAAVAGVGYLGYKGYERWFKKDAQALVRFRLAQYGFNMDKEAHSKPILELEKLVMPNVTLGNGEAQFTKNININQLVSIFGVTPNDKDAVNKLAVWFMQRFRPIFLTSMNAYFDITKDRDLHQADNKLAGDEKETYLTKVNALSMEPHPYTVSISPYADQKAVPYDASDVKSAYTKALRDVKKEKTRGTNESEEKIKEMQETNRNREETILDTIMSNRKAEREKYVDSLKNTYEKEGGFWNGLKYYANAATNAVRSSSPIEWLERKFTSATNNGSSEEWANASAAVTDGTTKEYQIMVYKAFMSAGFTDNQSRVLTAEIGRENGYQPKYLFGGHVDPHKGMNLGMLSWQGDRRTRLLQFLNQAGAIDGSGQIKRNQAALNAQARFVLWEMQNTHKKHGGAEFLANPNMPAQQAMDLLGLKYIKWRINDPKYRATGIKRRNEWYALINKQLGSNAGTGSSAPTSSAGVSAVNVMADTAKMLTNMSMAQAGRPNIMNYDGKAAGQAVANRFNQIASTGTYSAPSSNVAVASGGAAVSDFIKTLNPEFIKIGQSKAIRRKDKDVDLSGMNKDFMLIFYAMAGEYHNRTGQVIQINSAFRSNAKQTALYNAWIAGGKKGGAVARPGRSRHQSGIAIDINTVNANALQQLGLMSRYKFHRPVRGETWHLENTLFAKGAGKGTAQELADVSKGSVSEAQMNAAAAATSGLDGYNTSGGAVYSGSQTINSSEYNPVIGRVTVNGDSVATQRGGGNTQTSPKASSANPPVANNQNNAPTGKVKYFIGDSIADGYRNANKAMGVTKVGANPKTVLGYVTSTVGKNPAEFKKYEVYLSTGMSNNYSDLNSIALQMQELKRFGIVARVFGVSFQYPHTDGMKLNNQLADLCKSYGMIFLGGFNAGKDRVHPATYDNLPSSATAKATNSQTTPKAVTAPAAKAIVNQAASGFMANKAGDKTPMIDDEYLRSMNISKPSDILPALERNIANRRTQPQPDIPRNDTQDVAASILRDQLKVQRDLLNVVTEIRDYVKEKPAQASSQQAAAPTQPSPDINKAFQQFRQGDKAAPVSMSVRK